MATPTLPVPTSSDIAKDYNDALQQALDVMDAAKSRIEAFRSVIERIEIEYRSRHKGQLNDYVLIALHNASLL